MSRARKQAVSGYSCKSSLACPAGRQSGQSLRATKGDEAQAAMFFNRVSYEYASDHLRRFGQFHPNGLRLPVADDGQLHDVTAAFLRDGFLKSFVSRDRLTVHRRD